MIDFGDVLKHKVRTPRNRGCDDAMTGPGNPAERDGAVGVSKFDEGRFGGGERPRR